MPHLMRDKPLGYANDLSRIVCIPNEGTIAFPNAIGLQVFDPVYGLLATGEGLDGELLCIDVHACAWS
jgi:hypothetical protein